MKLKSILLTALAASTALVACDKSESTDSAPVDKMPKSVTVTLPNIAPQVRATGNAIADNSKVELNNFKVYFVKANGTAVTDEELKYDGNTQKTYFSNTDEDWATMSAASKVHTYHFLPYETAKVVVVGNIGGDVAYADLAARIESVPNDTEAGHPAYPLYGEDDLTEKIDDNADDKGHQNVYTATVTLEPRVSRFEIYGFQYEAATAPNTNLYSSVKVEKIALNHFYTQYNFVEKTPVEEGKVWDDPTKETAWTWIEGRDAWCDALALTLNAGEAKFVNGNTIADPTTEKGNNATGIITYGLAHISDKANNPELLVALHGTPKVAEGAPAPAEVPFYLHAKFQNADTGTGNNGAFVSGKIYRVFFKFDDTDIKQPQRCVELTVSVADWTVVSVTPEFGNN